MEEKKFTIDSDEKSILALTDETIEKMASVSDNPEVFKKILKDLRKLALSNLNIKKEMSITIDTDINTLSKLTDKTIKEICKKSPYSELMYQLFLDLRKSAKKEKVANGHIFWSWSYR
jgi:hypothetical protein